MLLLRRSGLGGPLDGFDMTSDHIFIGDRHRPMDRCQCDCRLVSGHVVADPRPRGTRDFSVCIHDPEALAGYRGDDGEAVGVEVEDHIGERARLLGVGMVDLENHGNRRQFQPLKGQKTL